jgi:localization factor PodJL
MKSDLAWHLGGVRRQALEVAREAAHRCGMSVDEWLDHVILDSARQQGVEPRLPAGPRSDAGDQDAVAARARSSSCLDMATDRLRDDVASIAVLLLNRASQKRSPELESLIKALIDKIERGELARRAHSPLGRLEELIAKLIKKLDASDVRLDQLEAIEDRLARLHLECQSIPSLARAPASAPTPEMDVLVRDVAELRQAEKQTRDSLEAVHGTLGHVVDRLAMIETDMRGKSEHPDASVVPVGAVPPALGVATSSPPPTSAHPPPQPDQASESDSDAAGGGDEASPADRTFSAEARRGAAEPSDLVECSGKSDFIAAARRAVQAARRQVSENRATTPPEIVCSSSAKPAGRIGKLAALIGIVTGVLAMLGGSQIARTLRISADEAKLGTLGQAAAAASVTQSAAAAPDDGRALLPAPALSRP